jgi:hypothetical protein
VDVDHMSNYLTWIESKIITFLWAESNMSSLVACRCISFLCMQNHISFVSTW